MLRIIARLNIGGPAIQAISLTQRLTAIGYRTVLVRGSEAPREGSMDGLARELGVNPVMVPSLGRELGIRDVVAFTILLKHILRLRPEIVHTHAAKAGALGRLAALAAGVPVTVHTFHGHVLEGYFPPRRERFFREMERWLARRTTRLIAVSPEVRADLVRLRVAPESKIEVIPLGFNLSRFVFTEHERTARRRAVRAEHGIDDDAVVVALVARLVPIKRVDRFLRVAERCKRRLELEPRVRLRFLIAGDGELHDQLLASAEASALRDEVVWTRFSTDVTDVYAASDVVVLTSDNEGTPVSLIEAHAASLPVVSTDVGGVRSVVRHGASGYVIDPRREDELASALAELVTNPATRKQFGAAGYEYVHQRFTLDRLVHDIDALYRRLAQENDRP